MPQLLSFLASQLRGFTVSITKQLPTCCRLHTVQLWFVAVLFFVMVISVYSFILNMHREFYMHRKCLEMFKRTENSNLCGCCLFLFFA